MAPKVGTRGPDVFDWKEGNPIDGLGGIDSVGFDVPTPSSVKNLKVTFTSQFLASATGVFLNSPFTLSLKNIEAITGTANSNVFIGNAGTQAFYGGSGNDTLDGGAGADNMFGGDGIDLYFVDNAGDVVSETNANAAIGGFDTVYSYLTNYTLGTNVENGRIMSAGTANLTGNSLNNTLFSGAGNNVLDGLGGTDTASYYFASRGVAVSLKVSTAQNTNGSGTDTLLNIENLTGSDFSDTLTGGKGTNVLSGRAGNDILNGSTDNDWMSGGDGNDTYYVDNAGDVVSETNTYPATGGTDTVITYIRSYTLSAGVENGRVGSAGAANLTGNGLYNTLFAGPGNNVLDGLGGLDTASYQFATSGVTVSLSTFFGAQNTIGSGTDTLRNIENLTGSSFNDTLSGNTGKNVLNGRGGNDVLDGGGGTDYFIFDTALSATTNVDTIVDFTVDDVIYLDKAIFTNLPKGFLSASYFRVGSTALDPNDYIIYDPSNGHLIYDRDGTEPDSSLFGGRTLFADLDTNLLLTAGDFFVI